MGRMANFVYFATIKKIENKITHCSEIILKCNSPLEFLKSPWERGKTHPFSPPTTPMVSRAWELKPWKWRSLVSVTAGLWRKVGTQEQNTLHVFGWASGAVGQGKAWGTATPSCLSSAPLPCSSSRRSYQKWLFIPRNGPMVTAPGWILPLHSGVTSYGSLFCTSKRRGGQSGWRSYARRREQPCIFSLP